MAHKSVIDKALNNKHNYRLPKLWRLQPQSWPDTAKEYCRV